MDDFLKQLRHPPPVGLLDGVDDCPSSEHLAQVAA